MRLLFLIFVLFSISLSAQTESLPATFLGRWTGDLQIFQTNQPKKQIPMQLVVEPLDQYGDYTFYIYYQGDTTSRNYILRTVDRAKGHFVLDERNGIIIDTYLINGQLMSSYEVLGTRIQTSISLEDDMMSYELVILGENLVRSSGDTVIQGDSIPSVQNYAISGLQKAILKKK